MVKIILFHLAFCAHPCHLAEEFDPDRFQDERLHKYLTPNPFIFLPFNAGPRICLGQQVHVFLSDVFFPGNLTRG